MRLRRRPTPSSPPSRRSSDCDRVPLHRVTRQRLRRMRRAAVRRDASPCAAKSWRRRARRTGRCEGVSMVGGLRRSGGWREERVWRRGELATERDAPRQGGVWGRRRPLCGVRQRTLQPIRRRHCVFRVRTALFFSPPRRHAFRSFHAVRTILEATDAQDTGAAAAGKSGAPIKSFPARCPGIPSPEASPASA